MSSDQSIKVKGNCTHLEVDATTGLTTAKFVFTTPPGEQIPTFISHLLKTWKIELPLNQEKEEEFPS